MRPKGAGPGVPEGGQLHVLVTVPGDNIAAFNGSTVGDRQLRLSEAPPAKPAPLWRRCTWRSTALGILAVAVVAAGIVLAVLGTSGKLTGSGEEDGTIYAVSARNRSYPVEPAFQAELHSWLLPAEVSSVLGSSTDADVIVIGAGVAGLAAAALLQARQLRVTVLEARVSEGRWAAACLPARLPPAPARTAASACLPRLVTHLCTCLFHLAAL